MSPLRRTLALIMIPLVIMAMLGVLLLAQGDTANARGSFALGVIAAAVCGASSVYQVKAWNLKMQSVVHFGIMLVTVLPAMYLSGWFILANAMDYLQVLGMFLMVGAVLWLLFYLIFGELQPRFSFKQVSS